MVRFPREENRDRKIMSLCNVPIYRDNEEAPGFKQRLFIDDYWKSMVTIPIIG